MSQQQIDFKQEEDCNQGQNQEWGSEASGNSGVKIALVRCINIEIRSWENDRQEKHSSTVKDCQGLSKQSLALSQVVDLWQDLGYPHYVDQLQLGEL